MQLTSDSKFTVSSLAPLLKSRKLSPLELTREILAKIERLQPSLNGFITVTAKLALKQARAAEKEILRGQYRGPLHGIPITLKDIFDVRGIRTTAGSKILRNSVAKENAVVTDRLLDAGVILLGKTNLHEFAFGATNVNPHYGSVHNPWDLERVSGGSSGGSAVAVATGQGLASLGTDTGGSIRLPAALCGIVGFKPTRRLVPVHGVIPLAPSLDHVGPLCRCVGDAAILMGAIAGPDPRDPDCLGKAGEAFDRGMRRGLRGLKIGVPKQYFFDRLQEDVCRAVLTAIQHLEVSGCEIREVVLKSMEQTADLAAGITVIEALAFHWKWLQSRPQDYGADLRTRMQQNSGQLAVAYLQLREKHRFYREEFARVFESVDLVVAPSVPVVAPKMDETEVSVGRTKEELRLALLRFTRPANLTGFPAISIPCGFSKEKMPVGLQLMGPAFGDATVLRAAYGYEQSTAWHTMFPDV
jgi:aspartyl-tRNA(Asn)/glutamyl-tRNA(Gln) amidotransferase subunit A